MDNHKNFERFQYLNFETSVLKIKNPFQKAGVMFLVKSAKIENLILWYKAAPSDTNVQTNGMGSANWTYHREWSFAQSLLFWKLCFSLTTSNKRVDLMYQQPKFTYSYCSLFHLSVFFPVSILNWETNICCYHYGHSYLKKLLK